MKDKNTFEDKIAPEFRRLRLNVPFRSDILRLAFPTQRLMIGAMKPPVGLEEKVLTLNREGKELRVRVISPSGAKNLPRFYYIHGGGFGYGLAPHHIANACYYAKQAGCAVYLPEYSLLPQYPFPHAYLDVVHCYRQLMNHSESSAPVAVGGDSAGGALAANLCNTVQAWGLALPMFQMLLYPVIDFEMNTPSMTEIADAPVWSAQNNRRMWKMYLRNVAEGDMELASPMKNPLPSKIPNTFIETAEVDCLHDEGVAYAKKLMNAGARVELYETKGTVHGYDCIRKSSITQESLKRRANALKQAFEGALTLQ